MLLHTELHRLSHYSFAPKNLKFIKKSLWLFLLHQSKFQLNCNVDLSKSILQYWSSSSILESWVGIFGQMTPTFKTSKFFSSAIYIWLEDQWRWSVIWHFQTHYNILYVKSVTRLMVWQESIMLGFIHFSLIVRMQNPYHILFDFFTLHISKSKMHITIS